MGDISPDEQAGQNLPKWIPSTIHYARWGWEELEPQPGKLNTEFLDKVLKETHDSGQKLAFRVMCCSTSKGHPYHPKWCGKELQADYEGQGPFPIPDMDDPVVLNAHLDFIKRLGEKYDGHPDIDHIDLGSIGWWGEWHLSGSTKCKLPTLENRKKVRISAIGGFAEAVEGTVSRCRARRGAGAPDRDVGDFHGAKRVGDLDGGYSDPGHGLCAMEREQRIQTIRQAR